MTDHNNWQRKYSMPHTTAVIRTTRRPNTCRNAWITTTNYSTDCCVSLSFLLAFSLACRVCPSRSISFALIFVLACLLFDLYECDGHTSALFICIVYGFVAVSMSTHTHTRLTHSVSRPRSLWSRVNKFMQTSKLCSRIWTIDLFGSKNGLVSAFLSKKKEIKNK